MEGQRTLSLVSDDEPPVGLSDEEEIRRVAQNIVDAEGVGEELVYDESIEREAREFFGAGPS